MYAGNMSCCGIDACVVQRCSHFKQTLPRYLHPVDTQIYEVKQMYTDYIRLKSAQSVKFWLVCAYLIAISGLEMSKSGRCSQV
jgi:hypothetical protein